MFCGFLYVIFLALCVRGDILEYTKSLFDITGRYINIPIVFIQVAQKR